jgi:hypothetical protein
MIAKEYNIDFTPDLSIQKGTTITLLIDCLRNTAPFFQSARSQTNLIKPLNENKLTQILVEQTDFQLRKKPLAIGVKNQYSDLFFGTKGIPDFYFHALEEGRTSQPLFICEAKRLPAPIGSLNIEYVIGDNKNGGIERFKIGKHGKKFTEGGMIGFIESESFGHWNKEVNSWITNLAKTNSDWNEDETLDSIENNASSSYLNSIVHRKSDCDLLLHHLWIN